MKIISKRLKYKREDSVFNVKHIPAPNKARTVIMVGGLSEHYGFLFKPLMREWARAGYGVAAIQVPYERHLDTVHKTEVLLQDVVAETMKQLKLRKPLLLLHSGASLILAAPGFDYKLFDTIVLWSSMGLHHPEKHPRGSWYAARTFFRHGRRNVINGLMTADWRIFGMSLAVMTTFVRNIKHARGLFQIFYNKNLRSFVEDRSNIVILHGEEEELQVLDERDLEWFRAHKNIQFEYLPGAAWNHCGLYSRLALNQTDDIIRILNDRSAVH